MIPDAKTSQNHHLKKCNTDLYWIHQPWWIL